MKLESQRLDLVLYHLRFFKTRALAQTLIAKGRVRINGEKTKKPARKIRIGDVLSFPKEREIIAIEITDLVGERVGAPIAQGCYRNLVENRP